MVKIMYGLVKVGIWLNIKLGKLAWGFTWGLLGVGANQSFYLLGVCLGLKFWTQIGKAYFDHYFVWHALGRRSLRLFRLGLCHRGGYEFSLRYIVSGDLRTPSI